MRSSEIHYCIAENRAIFMDITRNRYFALPAPLDRAFRRMHQGTAASDDPITDAALLKELREAGIANVADTLIRGQQRDQHHPSPTGEIDIRLGLDPVRVSTTFFTIVLRVVLRVMISLMPLRYAISYARHVKARAKPRPSPERRSIEIACALASSDIILRREGDCLARSLAAFILGVRIDERLAFVIGVRGQPFKAHAWVQVGDTLLTDSIDVVRLYSPIFVI